MLRKLKEVVASKFMQSQQRQSNFSTKSLQKKRVIDLDLDLFEQSQQEEQSNEWYHSIREFSQTFKERMRLSKAFLATQVESLTIKMFKRISAHQLNQNKQLSIEETIQKSNNHSHEQNLNKLKQVELKINKATSTSDLDNIVMNTLNNRETREEININLQEPLINQEIKLQALRKRKNRKELKAKQKYQIKLGILNELQLTNPDSTCKSLKLQKSKINSTHQQSILSQSIPKKKKKHNYDQGIRTKKEEGVNVVAQSKNEDRLNTLIQYVDFSFELSSRIQKGELEKEIDLNADFLEDVHHNQQFPCLTEQQQFNHINEQNLADSRCFTLNQIESTSVSQQQQLLRQTNEPEQQQQLLQQNIVLDQQSHNEEEKHEEVIQVKKQLHFEEDLKQQELQQKNIQLSPCVKQISLSSETPTPKGSSSKVSTDTCNSGGTIPHSPMIESPMIQLENGNTLNDNCTINPFQDIALQNNNNNNPFKQTSKMNLNDYLLSKSKQNQYNFDALITSSCIPLQPTRDNNLSLQLTQNCNQNMFNFQSSFGSLFGNSQSFYGNTHQQYSTNLNPQNQFVQQNYSIQNSSKIENESVLFSTTNNLTLPFGNSSSINFVNSQLFAQEGSSQLFMASGQSSSNGTQLKGSAPSLYSSSTYHSNSLSKRLAAAPARKRI